MHYALVCPKPPPSATPEQVQVFKEVTDPSVLQKRSSIKGKTVREAQKTFRVTDVNQIVEAGTYLRVHVHPKRFPRYNSSVFDVYAKHKRFLAIIFDGDWSLVANIMFLNATC